MNRAGRALLKTLGGLRIVWDVIGATLLLLIVLALGYTVVRGAVRRISRRPLQSHAYASEPWFRAWAAEDAATLYMRWIPYTYWRRIPFAGRYINVDSQGYRVTPQPVGAAPARQSVWFFGGSTMWGTGQRDSATIPAVVARSLESIDRRGVHVRNFGETGYVSTQGLIRLLLELRAGERPDVVVFYDGINDAAASAMSGGCGLPQNEGRRRIEFALGGFLRRRTWNELRALRRTVAEQSRLEGVPPLRELRETPALRALGHGIVECYAQNARLIETLGREYGFRAVYFWQPSPSVSPKPLTPLEQSVADSTNMAGLRPYLWVLNRVAASEIDSAMTRVAGARFRNLTGVFAGDTATVWLDYVGHLTERANAVVARSMVGTILGALDSTGGAKHR